MKHSSKLILYLFTLIFLVPMPHYAQDIINNNENNSNLQEEVIFLEEVYNKKLDDIISKKEALYEAQIQVIKSKNSLILLNDLSLPDYEKNQIINNIAVSLSNMNNVTDIEIYPTLDLINKINQELKLTNSEENEFIENLFIDILSLEKSVDSNINNIQIDEYNELDNKIKEFSKILNETDKTKNDIDALTNIIEISENKKTKINSRLLLEDDKIFDLIDEEKKLSINKIKFFIDLQNLNLIDPELEAKKEIKIINEELENIKKAINNKNLDINTNNKILIDNYKSLEKLYNANRYNEYLIKDDGSLVIFRDEEEKIKNIISDLEKNKSQFQNEINSLKKEVKLKDKEVKNIFKEVNEIKNESKIVEAHIKRIQTENNSLKLQREQINKNSSKNNLDLIKKYADLEKLYNTTRVGGYFLTENGALLSFQVEEEKIKKEIELSENNKKSFEQQINNLNKNIKINEEDIKTESINKFIKVKELLLQKKSYKALHNIENNLENMLFKANEELKEARLEGDLVKINQALKKKALASSKLQIARAEIAISKNKERRKLLIYKKDINLSNPNINDKEKKIIIRKYGIASKKIDFSNKKIKTSIVASVNKNKLKQNEEMLVEELSLAEEELKKARSEGDINKINQALKKKTLVTSKLQIARAEVSISENNEKSKQLKYDRDLKLTHPMLDDEKKQLIGNKYNNIINKLKFNNKKIDSDIKQFNKSNKLKQSEATLVELFNKAEEELKKARLEGDINKINQALKKRALTSSKLQIARVEIAITKNKEKSKLLEFDRDFRLSIPSLKLEERRKIHSDYSISVGQINLEYNTLKNKIRNSINARKLEQNKIDYLTASSRLKEIIEEGDINKIKKARDTLAQIEKNLVDTKNQFDKVKLNQILEITKDKEDILIDKINDLSNNLLKKNKIISDANKKVFLKSGQVFSNEYEAVFNGPSPKEKNALLKRIKNGSLKNVNVMSNNLLILNGEELIIIPMKDIIGQTDENLNSVILAAFDPKKSLSEIKDSINNSIVNDIQKNNKNKTDNNVESNQSNNIRNAQSKIKNDIKQVIKLEKAKTLAQKAANKANNELKEAKLAAQKAANELKSQINKEAYEKAKLALEKAKKVVVEKTSLAVAAATKAAIEASEHALAKAKVQTQQTLKNNALSDLVKAQDFADAKEAAQIQAQNYLNSLGDLLDTDPNKVAAQTSLDVAIAAKNAADAAEDSKEVILNNIQTQLDIANNLKKDAIRDKNLAEKEKDIYEKDLNEAKISKDKASKEVEEKKKLCSSCT